MPIKNNDNYSIMKSKQHILELFLISLKKFIVSHKQLETENLGAPVLRITRHAYLLAKALLQAKRKYFTTFSFMFKDISWSVGQK